MQAKRPTMGQEIFELMNGWVPFLDGAIFDCSRFWGKFNSPHPNPPPFSSKIGEGEGGSGRAGYNSTVRGWAVVRAGWGSMGSEASRARPLAQVRRSLI